MHPDVLVTTQRILHLFFHDSALDGVGAIRVLFNGIAIFYINVMLVNIGS